MVWKINLRENIRLWMVNIKNIFQVCKDGKFLWVFQNKFSLFYGPVGFNQGETGLLLLKGSINMTLIHKLPFFKKHIFPLDK